MDNIFDNKPEEQEMFETKYTDPNSDFEYNNSMDATPMSVGDWVLTILALFIPCAGVIIYLVWAFGKKGNVNRRNYCRAYLAIYAVIMLVYLVITVVFGAVFAGNL